MIVVSVASGTSADGLDVGLVDLRLAADGDLEVIVLDTRTDPWPDGLAARLLALLPPATTTAEELCLLDTLVGQAVGEAAARAVRRAPARPTLVVSPGQTVHHAVRDGHCLGTLQVGQPAWVAEATGLPVVSDLRARDVAAGGHGAPLAGILDGLWLGGPGGPRAALNLGGIANVSVVAEDGSTRAWDTGPANCLLDLTAARATGGRLGYDRDGALAAAGTVSRELLARLLEHPYLTTGIPASTGREVFSAAYLDAALAASPALPWEDVLATLVELTARTVADAVLPHAPTEVVASGGGTANPALMAALAGRLGDVPLLTSDDRGLPSDGKESVLWALLGFQTWHGVPVATGERRPRVLGRLTPGDEPLALPAPVPAPRRLRVTMKELVR